MNTKTITQEEFNEGARAAVLAALDGYMRDLTGTDNARGATDADLPALFAGLDAHMGRVAARFSDPESKEVGSACLSIALKENRINPPKGYVIVPSGEIKVGDRVWDDSDQEWVKVGADEIGDDAEGFFSIARKVEQA